MTLHLRALLLAACLLGVLLQAGLGYARSVEARAVYALAPSLAQPIKHLGLALQAEAFRQPDLVPLYGSSELEAYPGPFTATQFFDGAPTGYRVFGVGAGGMTPLLILERLAALGPEVKGKPIVILASPTFIRGDDRVRQSYYNGSFSALHGYEVVFGSSLSPELRRKVAERMLEYPAPLDDEPLLRFGLERLTGDTLLDRLQFQLAVPLGRLRALLLRGQDHWLTVSAAAEEAASTASRTPPSRAGPLNWTTLQHQADQLARERSANNTWGFENAYWKTRGADLRQQRGRLTDKAFLRSVKQDADWTDFELLLRGLRELGARPLVLSVPMKGAYYAYWGVSQRARDGYYRRVQTLVQRYGIPVHTFAEADGDRLFTGDERSHPSQLGWLAYDRAIDAFVQGARHK